MNPTMGMWSANTSVKIIQEETLHLVLFMKNDPANQGVREKEWKQTLDSVPKNN